MSREKFRERQEGWGTLVVCKHTRGRYSTRYCTGRSLTILAPLKRKDGAISSRFCKAFCVSQF